MIPTVQWCNVCLNLLKNEKKYQWLNYLVRDTLRLNLKFVCSYIHVALLQVRVKVIITKIGTNLLILSKVLPIQKKRYTV